MKSTSLWMLAVTAALFASCSKSDSPKPDTSREDLKVSLTGKWSIPNSTFPSAAVTGTGTHEGLPAGPAPTFFEFFADSTYVLVYNNSVWEAGKYNTVTSDSIRVEGIGVAGNIRFNGNKLSFRLTQGEGNNILPVNATKEPVVANDERTFNISQKWYVLKEDQWQETYEEGLDSVNVRFSNYGTYLLEGYAGQQLETMAAYTWKWHPAESDKLQLTTRNGTHDVSVRELSKNSLKISEWYEWDNTHEGVEEMKLNMRPAKK